MDDLTHIKFSRRERRQILKSSSSRTKITLNRYDMNYITGDPLF